jgi:uncharacterized protein (DUF1684 family)
MDASTFLDLADYRRRVGEIYARVRRSGLQPEERWQAFRQARDALFKSHPQSPLSPEQAGRFTSLRYYPYDPALRLELPVDPGSSPEIIPVDLESDGLTRLQRFGKVSFDVDGQTFSLSLYWILGYGGGIFLPFRDATGGVDTYGGGRYLLDTIKGVDLGQEGERLVIDFNYAYNPSCAYNSRWHCPLAPAENWLDVPIRAGELDFNPDL